MSTAPPPGMMDTAPQIGVAPLTPAAPEEPAFDYMPAGIDYTVLGVPEGARTPGLGESTYLPPRALARNLAHQDFAESKAADTGHKTALDTSDPILDSIRATQEHLNRRSEKLQQFAEELSKQQQALMGNVPKQPTGMAMPDISNQVSTLIAGLVRPGHMEAFTRSMLEQASDAQKAEFQNAMNAWQGKTSGIALQRKDLATQIGDIDTDITQSYRDEYQQGVLEDRRQGRADTLQSRADALESRTKQNASAMYDRAWQQKNVEGLRRHGAELGLSPEDIEAEVATVRSRIKSDHSAHVLSGIGQFRQITQGILDRFGEIPDEMVPDLERQRQLMADGLSIDGDQVRPDELGVIATGETMKGQEFDIKLPMLEKEECAKLAKMVAETSAIGRRLFLEEKRLAIAGYNADTSRYNAVLRQFEISQKQSNDQVDKAVHTLKQKLAGKQLELKNARPTKRRDIQSSIDDLTGQIGYAESQHVDRPTAAPPNVPPPVPGKRPMKGNVGKGAPRSGVVNGKSWSLTPMGQ